MSSFILKIIAVISMLFDHTGYLIYNNISWCNIIGRITFFIAIFLLFLLLFFLLLLFCYCFFFYFFFFYCFFCYCFFFYYFFFYCFSVIAYFCYLFFIAVTTFFQFSRKLSPRDSIIKKEVHPD